MYYYESQTDTYYDVTLDTIQATELDNGLTIHGTIVNYEFGGFANRREFTLWTALPGTEDLVCVQILESAYDGECTLDEIDFVIHAVFDGVIY